MRRTKKSILALGTFGAAFGVLMKMEACVCYRTVTCDFTVDDVCKWLWPSHIVYAMTDAFHYIRNMDKSEASETLSIRYSADEFKLTIRVQEARMCAPERGQVVFQDTPKRDAIESVLREIAEIHARFETVRHVIRWLNDNATPSAARYYFPVLGALLPADHPFHQTTGSGLFGEPKRPIAEIAASMREAMTTIASALISYDPTYQHEASTFKVEVDGSQVFCLI